MSTSERRRERREIHAPWWEMALRGNENGLFADTLRRVARLGSLGYAAGVRGRELAYRRGWLSVKRLPQPTICVGNITAGGTGKTPLVIRLAQDLMARGLRPAVLLRGYRRETHRRNPVIVRDPSAIRATLAESGDEAMELAMRLPGCIVGVGADRHAVGSHLLKQFAIDCFVLDDGFQHHRLQRDINIVTIDVTDPWGGGEMLPAGRLREPPQALRRADAVVLTRTASVGPDRLSVLRAEVSMWMQPDSGLLESRHEAHRFVAVAGGREHPLTMVQGKKVLVVSAIGNPQSFEQTLGHLGAEIVGALRMPDHASEPRKVREWIARNRRSAHFILMTEKDAMRWSRTALPPTMVAKAYALRMNLMISAAKDRWNHLLDLVSKMAHAR